MAKRFHENDGYKSVDLVHYGHDNMSAAFALFDSSHPYFLDPAGYLVHIGYECLLKAIVLEVSGSFPNTHDIEKLFLELSALNLHLSNEHKRTIKIINEYGKLRYPNRNDPVGITTEPWEAIEELIKFTFSEMPQTLHDKLSAEDNDKLVKKGGRILMRKEIPDSTSKVV